MRQQMNCLISACLTFHDCWLVFLWEALFCQISPGNSSRGEGAVLECAEESFLTQVIRKRRPTPASLVIMNEHMPPEKDEKRTNISQAESQSASPKQRKQSVFTPPALKGIKHLKSQSESVFPEEEEGLGEREEEWGH
ncbi:protein phosphatase 1 regulatory subunit 1C isoform X2 [Pyrgilauda ruficollis]|uniref:protein phosphatase 1 regulatory subunit 1C isoform X2 n=1 Tax=Pyrgilauda ruficollis TaxID=221976 RepID=UPI001B86623B|nr:protein phosphatase 1 regulatory subunit 1C isoform X2 [Pyrgilauda ruficollis]